MAFSNKHQVHATCPTPIRGRGRGSFVYSGSLRTCGGGTKGLVGERCGARDLCDMFDPLLVF